MTLRSKDQRTEKASPSFAEQMFPNLQPKPKAPVGRMGPTEGELGRNRSSQARFCKSPWRTGETRKVKLKLQP